MSQALMFTFLPNNLGSSNVIKLAMYFTQFLYSLPLRLMGAYVLCMVLVNN
jgi:hypothetical protein